MLIAKPKSVEVFRSWAHCVTNSTFGVKTDFRKQIILILVNAILKLEYLVLKSVLELENVFIHTSR